MDKTREFMLLLTFYETVLQSPLLTVEEKSAALNQATYDYSLRSKPDPFVAIAKRLSTIKPREPDAGSEAVGRQASQPSEQSKRRWTIT